MTWQHTRSTCKRLETACNPLNEVFVGCNCQLDGNISSNLMGTKPFLKPH